MSHGRGARGAARRRVTRVAAFARVRRCALPAFSVSASTQDHGASIAGAEVLQVDGDATCATVRTTGDEPDWLTALVTDPDDSFDARHALFRADRDGSDLGRKERTKERLGRRAELYGGHLGRCEHLEAVLHAACVARGDGSPRAFAAPRLLSRRAARVRDVTRDRHLDAPLGATAKAVGAVGAGEVERRRSVRPRRSTRSLAPRHGGQRPILEAARQAAALARRHTDRERQEPSEPSVPSRRRPHAAEPRSPSRILVPRIPRGDLVLTQVGLRPLGRSAPRLAFGEPCSAWRFRACEARRSPKAKRGGPGTK